MKHLLIAAIAAVALAAAVSCGTRTLRTAGQECRATTECEDGLLCDFAQEPAVCSGEGSGPLPVDAGAIDAPMQTVDAAIDAAIDAAAI